VVSFHTSVTLLPQKIVSVLSNKRKLDAAKHYSGHSGKDRTVVFMRGSPLPSSRTKLHTRLYWIP